MNVAPGRVSGPWISSAITRTPYAAARSRSASELGPRGHPAERVVRVAEHEGATTLAERLLDGGQVERGVVGVRGGLDRQQLPAGQGDDLAERRVAGERHHDRPGRRTAPPARSGWRRSRHRSPPSRPAAGPGPSAARRSPPGRRPRRRHRAGRSRPSPRAPRRSPRRPPRAPGRSPSRPPRRAPSPPAPHPTSAAAPGGPRRRSGPGSRRDSCGHASRVPSVGLEGRRTPRGLGHLGGGERGVVEVGVLGPPLLALGRQRVDRVVVVVRPVERLGVVGLDRGAVVLASTRRCRAPRRTPRAGAPSACRRTGTSHTMRGVAKPGR